MICMSGSVSDLISAHGGGGGCGRGTYPVREIYNQVPYLDLPNFKFAIHPGYEIISDGSRA